MIRANTKGYPSTCAAIGFADVRAGTQMIVPIQSGTRVLISAPAQEESITAAFVKLASKEAEQGGPRPAPPAHCGRFGSRVHRPKQTLRYEALKPKNSCERIIIRD